MKRSSTKNTFAIIFLVIFSLSLYALTIRGELLDVSDFNYLRELDDATEPFESSHDRGPFAHMISLVENGSYALTQELADFVYPDVGYYNGKFYSFFAPGMAYMATPFYLLGRDYGLAQLFTFGFVSIVSIFAIVFIFKIAREIMKLPLWASILAPIIFAFGSTAWSYGITLYQHHVTVFFIVSSFYATWRYGKNTRFSWTWGVYIWASYALAIFVDYANVVLMFPIVVYFIIQAFSILKNSGRWKINLRNSFIVTFIAFMLITGAHLYHNKTYFGEWTKLSGELISYKTLLENNIDPNDPYVDARIAKVSSEKNAIGFFSEFQLAHSFYTLTVASDRGLFVFAPIFILGFFGLLSRLRKPTLETATLAGLVIINIFLYSSWGDPWGGWAYGPRYLIPSMSILAIFTVYFLSHGSALLVKKLIAVPLFLYSSTIGLLGALTTNAVPPSIEAVGLIGDKSNFLYNIPFLRDEITSNFIFNTYLRGGITLTNYFVLIAITVYIVFIYLLFILSGSEES